MLGAVEEEEEALPVERMEAMGEYHVEQFVIELMRARWQQCCLQHYRPVYGISKRLCVVLQKQYQCRSRLHNQFRLRYDQPSLIVRPLGEKVVLV